MRLHVTENLCGFRLRHLALTDDAIDLQRQARWENRFISTFAAGDREGSAGDEGIRLCARRPMNEASPCIAR
jgi:hypothetical protein